MIIRDYYEHLYGNKMDNLEDMDRFLEKFNLLTLNQEEIEIVNNPIKSTEIEAVIKNIPRNKSPGPDGFTGEFCQTLREEPMAILKLFLKIAEGKTLPSSFYEATITLISKPKTTLQANITDEQRCKNPQKILVNGIQQHIKKLIHHDQVGVIPGMKGFFSSVQSFCLHGL